MYKLYAYSKGMLWYLGLQGYGGNLLMASINEWNATL